MPYIARVGDVWTGICKCHESPIKVSGTIVSGSGTNFADGIPVARIGDVVISSCGHSATIIAGSPTSTADGIPIARIGDPVASGCISGIIISGSATNQDGSGFGEEGSSDSSPTPSNKLEILQEKIDAFFGEPSFALDFYKSGDVYFIFLNSKVFKSEDFGDSWASLSKTTIEEKPVIVSDSIVIGFSSTQMKLIIFDFLKGEEVESLKVSKPLTEYAYDRRNKSYAGLFFNNGSVDCYVASYKFNPSALIRRLIGENGEFGRYSVQSITIKDNFLALCAGKRLFIKDFVNEIDSPTKSLGSANKTGLTFSTNLDLYNADSNFISKLEAPNYSLPWKDSPPVVNKGGNSIASLLSTPTFYIFGTSTNHTGLVYSSTSTAQFSPLPEMTSTLEVFTPEDYIICFDYIDPEVFYIRTAKNKTLLYFVS